MTNRLMTDNATLAEMGRRLRDAAQDAGMTLRELGDRMGVSRPTIYAYASGALRMSSERIRQASEITGKPVDFFDPRSLDHLDARSSMAQTLRLIDALLSPSSPAKASEAAIEALEKHPEAESPGIRAELLVKAGRALTLAGDYVTAVRHLETARSILVQEDSGEKTAGCCQTLGFCYTNLGRLDEARVCFEQALNLYAPESKWRSEVALAALAERAGDFIEADRLLSSLLDRPELPEDALVYVRANYASIVCTIGRWRSGLAQAETALAAAYKAGSKDQVAEMLVLAASALTHLGQLDEATLMVVRARDVCFTLQDEARSTLVQVCTAQLLRAFQDSDRARTLAHAAYTRAMEGQYRRSESGALILMAELALERADYQLARELSAQARSHGSAHRYVVASAMGAAFEALACSRLGLPVEAEQAIQHAERLSTNIGDGRARVVLLEAKAALHETLGDFEASKSVLAEALDLADDLGLQPDALRIAKGLAALESTGAEGGSSKTAYIDRITEGIMEGNLNSDTCRRLLMGLPAQRPTGPLGRGEKT